MKGVHAKLQHSQINILNFGEQKSNDTVDGF